MAPASGPPGSRTPIPWLQAKCPPIERAARKVAGTLRRAVRQLRRMDCAVARRIPSDSRRRTARRSVPATFFVSDRGRNRTHKITRLRAPTEGWSLAALPICVPGRNALPQCVFKLQAPVSNRAHRPHESRLGACQTCNRVTKGRVELPCPCRARRSERRVSADSTTSPQAARTGVEPVSRD